MKYLVLDEERSFVHGVLSEVLTILYTNDRVLSSLMGWARCARMQGLSERLREARHRLGLTQAELAEKTGVPYRTIQDGERGHSTPGSTVLAAYANLNIDVSWLLTGRDVLHPPGPAVAPLAAPSDGRVRGRRFRMRGRRIVRIPHYDPLDPDGFDPDEPDSVLSLAPSRLAAFNPDYALLDRDWGEIASTIVVNADAEPDLKRGTLVLFDSSITAELPGGCCIVRLGNRLMVQPASHSRGMVVGRVVFAFQRP